MTGRRRAATRVAALLTTALLIAPPSAAAPSLGPAAASDFCFVSVPDTGVPDEIEVRQSYRLLTSVLTFPGSPLIAIKPLNRRGLWTVSEDYRFVPLTEGSPPRELAFPDAAWTNQFATEHHSGRILGAGSIGGLWALPPGAARFSRHDPPLSPPIQAIRGRTLRYVPEWRATVFGGPKGLFVARDDEPIAEVRAPDGRPVGDVTSTAIIPGRGAFVFQVFEGQVGIVSGRLAPERVRWLFTYPQRPRAGGGEHRFEGQDSVWTVLPMEQPDTYLVQGIQRAHVLHWPSGGEPSVVEVERPPPFQQANDYRRLAPGTRDYMVYVQAPQRDRLPSEAGLLRLDGTRFVRVPWEGSVAPGPGEMPGITEAPSRDLLFLSLRSGHLFAYRNRALALVPDSVAILGAMTGVRDLPTIGRVIVALGRYELSHDLRLLPLSELPPPPALSNSGVFELPESGVAVVVRGSGFHVLGPEGGFTSIPGSETVGERPNSFRYLPSRREVLFASSQGLFMLVDRRLSGDTACLVRH